MTPTYGQSCGSCGGKALVLNAAARIGGPCRNHATTIDGAALYACRDCPALQVEMFNHDCWHHPTDEEWDMCFRFRVIEVERVRSLLAACVRPLDETCDCALHAALRSTGGHLAPTLELERLPRYGQV